MSGSERIVIPPQRISFEHDGKIYWQHEQILAQLLLDDVCHLNTGEFDGEKTVCCFVICNDIFAWGCADSECVTRAELPELYKMHAADPRWGATKWCIARRGEYPQRPVLAAMKEEGAWDLDESRLQPNSYDAVCARQAQERLRVEAGEEEGG
jgi:hypothetical protein